MTAEQYLSQAYRLDQRISLDQEELENLRALACSIGSPGFEEHYNPNHPTEASFVKTLSRIWELKEKLNSELNRLIRLREEIPLVIARVNDVDERLVLNYRYLRNMSWTEIGDELGVSDRTVRRWYNSALSHVEVPEEKNLEKT